MKWNEEYYRIQKKNKFRTFLTICLFKKLINKIFYKHILYLFISYYFSSILLKRKKKKSSQKNLFPKKMKSFWKKRSPNVIND